MENRRLIAMLAVVLGATLFGFLGICTRYFHNDCGLTSLDTVSIRLTFASLFLLIILGVLARKKLRITMRDIPLIVLFSIFKVLSDITLFYAQSTIQLGLATLLQMTAPYYVMLASLLLFREKLTGKKIAAMAMGSAGAIMVTGVLFGDFKSEAMGCISALLSGVFFGMFLIGSKVTGDRGVHPAASLFYTLLFADLIILPFVNHGKIVEAVFDPQGIVMALALGVLMTLVPFFLYAWSTQHIEPTISSTISVLEVVSATIVGFVFFGEGVSPVNVLGMSLVILSVVLLNIKFHSEYTKRHGPYVLKKTPLTDKADNAPADR
jgi:drug/metabolite transporter (DMT)-like permease